MDKGRTNIDKASDKKARVVEESLRPRRSEPTVEGYLAFFGCPALGLTVGLNLWHDPAATPVATIRLPADAPSPAPAPLLGRAPQAKEGSESIGERIQDFAADITGKAKEMGDDAAKARRSRPPPVVVWARSGAPPPRRAPPLARPLLRARLRRPAASPAAPAAACASSTDSASPVASAAVTSTPSHHVVVRIFLQDRLRGDKKEE